MGLIKSIKKDKYILYIIFIGLCLYIPLVFFKDITPRNELKYINIVENMIKNNDFLTLTFSNEVYTDKPPLFFWLILIIKYLSFGYNTFILTTVLSVIPAIAIGIILYNFLSSNGFKKERAFITVLLLFSLLYFIASSVILRMDMLMTVFIVLALVSFYNLVENKTNKYYLPYIYIGIGFFIKGLAAIFIPILVVLIYLLVTKQQSKIKLLKLGKGIGIILLFVLSWILPIIMIKGFDYFKEEFLIKQILNRSVNATVHKRPFYYYFMTFFYTLFPWYILFFPAIYFFAKYKLKDNKLYIYVLIWFLVPLVFFSSISSKLDIYLIPTYPAIAIIITNFLFSNRKIVKIFGTITLILFIILFMAVIFRRNDFIVYDQKLFTFFLIYSLLSVLFSFMAYLAIKKNKIKTYFYIVFFNVLMLSFVITISFPFVNEYIGFSKTISIIKREMKKDDDLEFLGYNIKLFDRMNYTFPNKIHEIQDDEETLNSLIAQKDLIIYIKNDALPLVKNYNLIYSNKESSIIIVRGR